MNEPLIGSLVGSRRFSDMIEDLVERAGGPDGPYLDGRVLAGLLNDGLTSLMAGAVTLEPLYVDQLNLTGKPIGSSIRDAARKHFDAVNAAPWDTFGKYLYWQLVSTDTNKVLGEPARFDSLADLYAFIRARAPHSGSRFSEALCVYAFDVVNNTDLYPQLRRCRNSMFASIWGRKKWAIKRDTEAYGISPKFNAGSYYQDAGEIDAAFVFSSGVSVNWYNRMAANFVHHYSINRPIPLVVPGTNNDDAIWTTWRTRSRWNWPKVGNNISVGTGSRGAVWDTGASNWVSPAPAGAYQLQAPFLLFDGGVIPVTKIPKGDVGTLRLIEISQLKGNAHVFGGVSSMVFPALRGTSLAFVMFPNGADTWITEYLDPSLYDLNVKSVFRHQFQSVYRTVPPKQHDGLSETMFKIWEYDQSGTSQLWSSLPRSGTWRNIDNDALPVGYDVARRDKETGTRSPWRKLFQVRRRIPNGNSRIDPAFM